MAPTPPRDIDATRPFHEAETLAEPQAVRTASDPELPDLPGFRILRLIAQGGMGRIYLARQESLDREVALKLIRPELAEDREIAERFLREARILARLRHPGVVAVYDAGQAGGRLYIATEFIAGGDLAARLERDGRLPEAEALRIAIAVAEALATLHAAGLVHRDVKPENILLDGDTPKLTDLGLARAADGEDRVTVTGAALGTPAFMAPEQADGRPEIDGRCDVYALAATLYAMIAGEPPFTGATPWAVVGQVLTRPAPDLRDRRPDATPALADLIARCLDKDPARRPGSARDLAEALRAIAAGEAPRSSVVVRGPQRPARRGWRPGRLMLGVVAVGVIVALGLGLAMLADGAPASDGRPAGGGGLDLLGSDRPEWARANGEDRFGHWAEIAVGGTRHRLRWCPPGSFTMGSPPDEAGHRPLEDQRQVTIADGFWIGATEVPQELWRAVMDGNPSALVGARHPVEQVSWEQAQDFVQGLAAITGAPVALPSAAQWEYACRAGAATGPFGAWSGPDELRIGLAPDAGHLEVASKPPNPWGLHEMLGNVAEWCRDESEAATDDGEAGRIVRGGTWFSSPQSARAAASSAQPRDFSARYLGLRVVVAGPPPE